MRSTQICAQVALACVCNAAERAHIVVHPAREIGPSVRSSSATIGSSTRTRAYRRAAAEEMRAGR